MTEGLGIPGRKFDEKRDSLDAAAVLTASTVGSVGGSFDAWAAEDMTAIVTWDFAEGIDGWYYDATSSWNDSCAGKDNVSVLGMKPHSR